MSLWDSINEIFKEVNQMVSEHKTLSQGVWGVIWGVLFAIKKGDKISEIIWKGILTGGIGIAAEGVVSMFDTPSKSVWFVIIVISSIGADVVLYRVSRLFYPRKGGNDADS